MKMINFFQIRWVLQMCQDFNSQDFELIIFGIVSAVCIQAPEHSYLKWNGRETLCYRCLLAFLDLTVQNV